MSNNSGITIKTTSKERISSYFNRRDALGLQHPPCSETGAGRSTELEGVKFGGGTNTGPCGRPGTLATEAPVGSVSPGTEQPPPALRDTRTMEHNAVSSLGGHVLCHSRLGRRRRRRIGAGGEGRVPASPTKPVMA